MPKLMAQYPKIESIGGTRSMILGLLEVQVPIDCGPEDSPSCGPQGYLAIESISKDPATLQQQDALFLHITIKE